jgi:hypothetical protein
MQNKEFNKMYAKIRDLNDDTILDEGAWSDLWHGTRQEKKSDQATKDAYDAYRLEKITKKFEKDGLSPEDARKYAYRKVYGAPVEEADSINFAKKKQLKLPDNFFRNIAMMDNPHAEIERLLNDPSSQGEVVRNYYTSYSQEYELDPVKDKEEIIDYVVQDFGDTTVEEAEPLQIGTTSEIEDKYYPITYTADISYDSRDRMEVDNIVIHDKNGEMLPPDHPVYQAEVGFIEDEVKRTGEEDGEVVGESITNEAEQINNELNRILKLSGLSEATSPPEVINPTKDSSPADLKAAIKYAKYMKAKMDTDKATATYDKEIDQLEGWLKSKSTMKTEGKMSGVHQDAQENDKEDFIAMHKDHMSAEEAGKMWDEVQKQMNEDFDSSHPDFPKAQAYASEKDAVKDIIAKHPEAAKTLQQSGDVFSIYDTDLYLDLFDHFAEDMPYGTQKGRDGDPVEWINDELDTMGILESIVAYKVEEGTQKPFVSLTKGIWTVTDGNGNDVNGFDNKEEAFLYLEKHYDELLDPQPIRLKRTQSDIDYMKQMDNSHALIYGESRNTYFHKGDKEFKVIPEGYKKTKNGTITKVLK